MRTYVGRGAEVRQLSLLLSSQMSGRPIIDIFEYVSLMLLHYLISLCWHIGRHIRRPRCPIRLSAVSACSKREALIFAKNAYVIQVSMFAVHLPKAHLAGIA